ncbi:hypothetical protein MGU_05036 [Metarhizium guizhouense ARSEF 977]|uniref:Uncharacterized protein n=1 Tax=Metarhizium guizhouense (strain ARSEF 977) TaxID=1276136 RepID=A0A0B4GYC3_METGA|nr:hypothetical protein MGU_05036 [Metarhizium guizhouense ARSEF 977]
MVLPGNFLKLGLGLNPRRDLRPGQDGALVRVDNAAEGIPSYATNIERFHYTVKRARSIIESRDATVAVSQSEIHSILTKIEELDRQVRALLPNGPEPTSPVPRLGPGSQPTSDKTYGAGGARDQDCDAENLIYDLGARAVVDADGHVSGHPLFRRNSNCPMESAVNGKDPANAGGSSDSPKGSAKSGTAANGGDRKANPNTSPPTGDASSENHKSGHPKGADTSPEEKQQAKAEGGKGSAMLDVPGSEARTGLPQVVSATVEMVEVKTVPVNGELVMTTVTRTTTRLSTVTVVRHHKATGSAAKQTPDGTGKGVEKPKVSQNVPVAPSAGSFAQFSNDTSKFSNSTAASHASQAEDQKTVDIAVDDKSFNHTAVDKTQGPEQIGSTPVQESEEAGNIATPQDAVSLTPEKSANHTAAPDKVVGTPSQQAANLTETGDSGAKAANTTADKVASTPNQQQAANLTGTEDAGKETSNTAADEVASTPNQQQAANLTGTEDAGEKAADTVADDTSLSSASEPDTNPAPDTGDLNGRVKVITVVPIPAQLGGASPAAATAAGSPDMAREKAEPAVSAAVGANEAVRRAETGFKTVRVPGSK